MDAGAAFEDAASVDAALDAPPLQIDLSFDGADAYVPSDLGLPEDVDAAAPPDDAAAPPDDAATGVTDAGLSCSSGERECMATCAPCPGAPVSDTTCVDSTCVAAACEPPYDVGVGGTCELVEVLATWSAGAVASDATPTAPVSASGTTSAPRVMSYVDATGTVHRLSLHAATGWTDVALTTDVPAVASAIVTTNSAEHLLYITAAGAVRYSELSSASSTETEVVAPALSARSLSATSVAGGNVFATYRTAAFQLHTLHFTGGSVDDIAIDAADDVVADSIATNPTLAYAHLVYTTRSGGFYVRQWNGVAWTEATRLRLEPTFAHSLAAGLTLSAGLRVLLASPGGGLRMVLYTSGYWTYRAVTLVDSLVDDVSMSALADGSMYAALRTRDNRILTNAVY